MVVRYGVLLLGGLMLACQSCCQKDSYLTRARWKTSNIDLESLGGDKHASVRLRNKNLNLRKSWYFERKYVRITIFSFFSFHLLFLFFSRPTPIGGRELHIG